MVKPEFLTIWSPFPTFLCSWQLMTADDSWWQLMTAVHFKTESLPVYYLLGPCLIIAVHNLKLLYTLLYKTVHSTIQNCTQLYTLLYTTLHYGRSSSSVSSTMSMILPSVYPGAPLTTMHSISCLTFNISWISLLSQLRDRYSGMFFLNFTFSSSAIMFRCSFLFLLIVDLLKTDSVRLRGSPSSVWRARQKFSSYCNRTLCFDQESWRARVNWHWTSLEPTQLFCWIVLSKTLTRDWDPFHCPPDARPPCHPKWMRTDQVTEPCFPFMFAAFLVLNSLCGLWDMAFSLGPRWSSRNPTWSFKRESLRPTAPTLRQVFKSARKASLSLFAFGNPLDLSLSSTRILSIVSSKILPVVSYYQNNFRACILVGVVEECEMGGMKPDQSTCHWDFCWWTPPLEQRLRILWASAHVLCEWNSWWYTPLVGKLNSFKFSTILIDNIW